MKESPRLAILVLLALAIALAGCSGVTRPGQVASPNAARGGLPGIPLEREASSITETIILGKDAELHSAEAQLVGTALSLPSAATPQWALYRFNTASQPLDSLNIVLESQLTAGAFVGLADYAAGTWAISGPYEGPKTIAIDNPAYLSPAGNVWIAVISPEEQPAVINALSVRRIAPSNVAPTGVLTADVTSGFSPLTVNFDASGSSDADGSLVEYAWDWEGDGLFDTFGSPSQVSHVFVTPGLWNTTVRVMDDQFAHAEASLAIAVTEKAAQPPIADLQGAPSIGNPPLLVSFDASASIDPDGAIVKYEWDWESDGTFDAYGTSPTTNHAYVTPGPFHPLVQVTDDAGNTSTAMVGPVIVHGWATSPNPSGSIAIWPASPLSLVVSGERPIICSDSFYGTELQIMAANDESGVTWAAPVGIPGTTGGAAPSMAVINGFPAVSYLHAADDQTLFIRAVDQLGFGWGSQVQIEDNAHRTSLARISGRPSVSLGNDFLRANDANGNTWADGAFGSQLGSPSVLRVVSGNPAICRYGNSAVYVRANDSEGSTWGAQVQINANASITSLSLAIVNGSPAVAFWDGAQGTLKFTRASDVDGTTWPAPQTFDSDGIVGQYCSLEADADGHPIIAYYDYFNSDLKFIRAADLDGAAWEAPVVLDSIGNVGEFLDMAMVDGRPSIAYWDSHNYFVKYMRRW